MFLPTESYSTEELIREIENSLHDLTRNEGHPEYPFDGKKILRDLNEDATFYQESSFAFAYAPTEKYSKLTNNYFFIAVFDCRKMHTIKDICIKALKSPKCYKINFRIYKNYLIVTALLYKNYHDAFFKICLNPCEWSFDVSLKRNAGITVDNLKHSSKKSIKIFTTFQIYITPSEDPPFEHFTTPEITNYEY